MRDKIQRTLDDARISPDELKTQLLHIKEIDLEKTRDLNTHHLDHLKKVWEKHH